MENKKGLYEKCSVLYCNKCKDWINKCLDTIVIEEEVYCIHCNNWLCGEGEAFGYWSENEEKNE